VSRVTRSYEPRRAADSVLYQVVRDHYETFRAQASALRDGEGLPRFIDDEFHGFLRCGWLAGGFARFQCSGCGLDRLVPFSCKGRAVCPSCGGRRMGGTGGPPRRPRVSSRACAPVGAESAAPAALHPRVGPRAVPCSHRRLHASSAWRPSASGSRGGCAGGSRRCGRGSAALWVGSQSQSSFARAGARRRLRGRRIGSAALSRGEAPHRGGHGRRACGHRALRAPPADPARSA